MCIFRKTGREKVFFFVYALIHLCDREGERGSLLHIHAWRVHVCVLMAEKEKDFVLVSMHVLSGEDRQREQERNVCLKQDNKFIEKKNSYIPSTYFACLENSFF